MAIIKVKTKANSNYITIEETLRPFWKLVILNLKIKYFKAEKSVLI